jgi:aspartyl-tRNA(Asn)/glutamyl-tRNA(Gln) amidotransferase subunit A
MSAAETTLADLTLIDAARYIEHRELSPSELLESVLDRIGRLEPSVLAFVTVCAEHARREAQILTREQAAGRIRGPLHGIPFGIKDLFDTAGIRTTSSSKVRADYVPDRDATVVARLRSAGAIVVGKTNTHEFAYGAVTPPTCNPWSLDRIPGGSSGGSGAAVAGGMCTAAVGSDTGGSIRIPAAFCGVVGLKPTYGRVPKSGVTPLAWSLDHVGPLTKCVGDAAMTLGVIAGRDDDDPTSAREPVDDYMRELDASLKSLRVGMPPPYFRMEIHPEVLEAVDAAARELQALGATLVEVDVHNLEHSTGALGGIIRPEASAYHQPDLRASADLYDASVRPRLEMGELYQATHYLNAQRVRGLIKESLRTCFVEAHLDALLVPTAPLPAPRHGQDRVTYPGHDEQLVMLSLIRYCAPFNLSGQPVLTIPCGFSSEGLPIGLGIVGRPFEESTILRIGQAYERATEWHRRRVPDLDPAALATAP